VCLALTERFLLTRHTSLGPARQEIRDHYNSLPEKAKADGPTVPFLVLDRLVREIEPHLLPRRKAR
jgi:hypothetical protein